MDQESRHAGQVIDKIDAFTERAAFRLSVLSAALLVAGPIAAFWTSEELAPARSASDRSLVHLLRPHAALIMLPVLVWMIGSCVALLLNASGRRLPPTVRVGALLAPALSAMYLTIAFVHTDLHSQWGIPYALPWIATLGAAIILSPRVSALFVGVGIVAWLAGANLDVDVLVFLPLGAAAPPLALVIAATVAYREQRRQRISKADTRMLLGGALLTAAFVVLAWTSARL